MITKFRVGLVLGIGVLVLLFFLFLQPPNYLFNSSENLRMNTVTSISPGSIELVHGQDKPNFAVIWLHGLGASANDFPGVVPELGLQPDKSIRFIFPQAPNRPVTVNGGMVMPAWYDIKGISIDDKQDAVGMQQSFETLEALIQSQVDLGIPSEHIIIAGFSQGGAVSYYTGVRTKHQLAGILALSTYLPFAELTQEQQSGANITTSIFASHGTYDPVVPVQLGQMSVDQLKQLGYSVEWQTYPMEHNVVLEQIQAIGQWMNQVFND